MSCLVSYSESSSGDEEEEEENQNDHTASFCTDAKLSSLNEDDKNWNSSSNRFHSAFVSSKDLEENDCKTAENPLKTTDPVASGSTPVACEGTLEVERLRRKRKVDCSEKQPLKLPNSIQQMYGGKQHVPEDNPALHQNRIRSFPHEVGNWATHVYIPVRRHENLVSFVQNLMEHLLPQGFELLPEFHVSLSRTVVIRHHWIEPLVDSLKDQLQHISTSLCDIIDVKLFSNDEKTRTFVCLELSEEDTELLNYVKAVDHCFKDFRLAPYYEKPSFHISVGWCLGDIARSVSSKKLSKAKEMLSDFVSSYPDLSVVYAHQICCRSGNKSFVITLKDSSNRE